MPKISVIVPVYKVEPYLRRCVDSILAQTFTDFELILVDDGSPDNCGQICDEYAKQDNRIVVIHKENGGLSDARNAGLDVAQGEWITFVDSDDWVHKDYLRFLYEAATNNHCPLSITRPNDVTAHIKDKPYVFGFKSSKPCRSLFVEDKFLCYAWGRLYKKDLWANIRFVKGMLMEDCYTIPEVVLKAASVAVVEAPLYYYYRANEGSITNALRLTEKFFNDVCLGYKKNIGLFEQYGFSEFKLDLIKRYLLYCLWAYQDIANSENKKFKRVVKRQAYAVLRQYGKLFSLHSSEFEWMLCRLSFSFRIQTKIMSIANRTFKK